MKLFIKLFDFGNRDRIFLGVFDGIAQMIDVEPIIVRIAVILLFMYFSIFDNMLGTAIILYIATYLSGLFVLYVFGVDQKHPEFNHLFLAKYILNKH